MREEQKEKISEEKDWKMRGKVGEEGKCDSLHNQVINLRGKNIEEILFMKRELQIKLRTWWKFKKNIVSSAVVFNLPCFSTKSRSLIKIKSSKVYFYEKKYPRNCFVEIGWSLTEGCHFSKGWGFM